MLIIISVPNQVYSAYIAAMQPTNFIIMDEFTQQHVLPLLQLPPPQPAALLIKTLLDCFTMLP